jgi:hypothetical protein
MPQTLKQILDAVLNEAGLLASTAYATSTASADLQMVALANRSATMLRTLPGARWRKAASITLTGAATYALPTDFLSYVPDSAYLANDLNEVVWPTSAAMWAELKSGLVSPASTLYVRQLGTTLSVHNSPASGTLSYEYWSNAPLTATDGTTLKERFTADSDIWQWDDELLKLDIRWRFKKEHEFADWQIDAAEAEKYKRFIMSKEYGAKTISPGGDEAPINPPSWRGWAT